VTAAYGPLWLNICSLLALIAGRSATMYLLLFRLAAFAAHLVNIILVMAILRTQGRSNRIVALGMFLYAWNPLVFVESCLSGHNDIFMITFILLGVLFCAKAEQQGFTRPIHYLLPAIALTLAGLIKFTALPLVALYLVLLVRKTLYAPTDDGGKSTTFAPSQLRAAIFRLLLAGIASGLTIVLFYGPFFIGHSIPAIVNSFTSPPSSHSAEHSIMQALVDWVAHHGMPAHTSVLYPLLSRLIKYKVWSYITILVVLSALVAGSISLWRAPTTRTFVLAGIAVLGALLIVTTWFYPWYVTWLVGLAAVSLPLSRQCIARALCAFALAFAVSARMTYLYLGLVYVDASAISIVATMTPPLLAFLFFLAIDKLPWERALPQSASAVSEA
jgi:hypothetical protein